MTRIFILALFSLFIVQPAVAVTTSLHTTHHVKTSTKRSATNKKTASTAHAGKKTSHHSSKASKHHHHHAKLTANHGLRTSPVISSIEDASQLSVPLTQSDTPVQSNRYMRWASSVEHRLVGMVQKTIQNIHYSNYKMGGSNYDPARGIYILDCSDYVDHLLIQSNPQAYYSLVSGTGTDKPTTADYYRFFNRLPEAASSSAWRRISIVKDVQPGDILVFRGMGGGGHVMVVMDKPVPAQNNDVFLVRVADSARSGHSQDTRPLHASGIGIGTMMLKVDPRTEQVAAYSWKMGAPWKNNVNFAIARPANA